MDSKPMVSIITVSYNSGATIYETIQSVLNQTYSNIEYLIIDGASTDNTVEIAESFTNRFQEKNIAYRIVSEKDYGIYDAMNKGVRLSCGEIIGILNSDDFYFPDTIEKVVNFYSLSNFDIMYGDLRVFSNKQEFIKKSKKTKKFNTRYWNHPTTFVTRKVYAQQQYACESIYDDLNFMLAARNNGYHIKILNETLANYRLGGISNKNSFKLMKSRLKLRNKIYKKNGCKGYRFNNFLIEFAKFILAK